jgi:hypothetical protein
LLGISPDAIIVVCDLSRCARRTRNNLFNPQPVDKY